MYVDKNYIEVFSNPHYTCFLRRIFNYTRIQGNSLTWKYADYQWQWLLASARAGQNSEPRSSLWWVRGGGRTITIRMLPLCLQNMQQIKTKTDHFTRLWGITTKTWDLGSYIMCIVPLCQWIFAFYHPTTIPITTKITGFTITIVWLYLNIG